MVLKLVKKKLAKTYTKLQLKKYGYVFETGKCKLNYLYIPNTKSDELLVVFSGYGNPGDAPRYNYIRSFQNLNVNRLYILDDSAFDGAYYLGKDNDFYVSRAVQKLIDKITVDLGITKEKVTVCGSSKGGTSSLYVGLKYGYGKIIAGGPQIYIGDWLVRSGRSETANHIIGKESDESKEALNKLLFDTVTEEVENIKSEIIIHVGKGDRHYRNHVIPFTEHLSKHGLDYYLDVADYNSHDELATYFAPFAIKKIKE